MNFTQRDSKGRFAATNNQGSTAMSAEKQQLQNCDVIHEGSRIILPITPSGAPLSYDEGIFWLTAKRDEENRTIEFVAKIDGEPSDAAVAFVRAIKQKFGWMRLVEQRTFFGTKPPMVKQIPCGPNGEREEVVLGFIQIPGVDGEVQTAFIQAGDGTVNFFLIGKIKKKHKPAIDELVQLTEQILAEKSIFKGHAIRMNFNYLQRRSGYDMDIDVPRFMDLDRSIEQSLIFSDKVRHDLEIGLFAPIEYTAACRKNQIPLKRGVLLYGPYGTGKTLTATVTAIKARANGWTFIYLDTVMDLAEGLRFAARYAPAVVFCEDIDRAITGSRSIGMDQILNILDGVDTKSKEIITVFTTNHIEKINPALLRMGRLDTLAEISPPDADAAIRLVLHYGRGLLAQDSDLREVGEALNGKIPAMIREVVERAKIAAIYRRKGEDILGDIEPVDLLNAASAMETHNAMLTPCKPRFNPRASVVVRIPATHSAAEELLWDVNNNIKDVVKAVNGQQDLEGVDEDEVIAE